MNRLEQRSAPDIMDQILNRINKLETEKNQTDEKISSLSQKINSQQEEINQLKLSKNVCVIDKNSQSIKTVSINPNKKILIDSSCGVGKIILKISAKKIMTTKIGSKLLLGGVGKYITNTQIVKNFLTSKAMTKYTGEMVGKKVPVLGLGIGLFFSIQRFLKGEVVKGFGEIFSGGLSCFPGYGTAGSIAIDAVLLGDDVRLAFKEKEVLAEKTLIDSYEILGFEDVKKNGFPSKEDVNEHYRELQRQFHPDKAQESGYGKDQFKDFSKALNEAKDLIYKDRKW